MITMILNLILMTIIINLGLIKLTVFIFSSIAKYFVFAKRNYFPTFPGPLRSLFFCSKLQAVCSVTVVNYLADSPTQAHGWWRQHWWRASRSWGRSRSPRLSGYDFNYKWAIKSNFGWPDVTLRKSDAPHIHFINYLKIPNWPRYDLVWHIVDIP